MKFKKKSDLWGKNRLYEVSTTFVRFSKPVKQKYQFFCNN